jgi:ectoine hydroxylase-related dioxygenase (phytanoyl-CoA dioxygenase family)
MHTRLTEQQISDYRDNGFLVVEGFLDADELEEWRRCTGEAVEQRLASDRLHNQANPENYYARVFTQCLRLADTHPGMRRLLFDPSLGEMAATLAGVDGIRIWHDQALIKPPYGNPTGWHLDVPYWSFSSRDAISIWVALDDATLSNGCMYYLPGSHKTARFDNAGIGQNIADLFKVYPEWLEIDPVACPCPAGSAVFHNGLTAHGAGANMTRHARRAMTCGYMPDGCTFNGTRNILPEEYFASLKIGDVLDDEQQNPLIWHRGRDGAGGSARERSAPMARQGSH